MDDAAKRKVGTALAIQYWQTRTQPPSSNLAARAMVPTIDEFLEMVETVERLAKSYAPEVVPVVEDGAGDD